MKLCKLSERVYIVLSAAIYVTFAVQVNRETTGDLIKDITGGSGQDCSTRVRNSYISGPWCRCSWQRTVYSNGLGYACIQTPEDLPERCLIEIFPKTLPLTLVDLGISSAPQLIGELRPPDLIKSVCSEIVSIKDVSYWNDPNWISIGTTFHSLGGSKNSDLEWKSSNPNSLSARFQGLLLKIQIRCKSAGFQHENCAMIKIKGQRKHPYNFNSFTTTSSSTKVVPSTSSKSIQSLKTSIISYSSTVVLKSTTTKHILPVTSTSIIVSSTTIQKVKPTSSINAHTSTKVIVASSSLAVTTSYKISKYPMTSSVAIKDKGPEKVTSGGGSKTVIVAVVSAIVGVVLVIVCVVGFYKRKRLKRPSYMKNMQSPNVSTKKILGSNSFKGSPSVMHNRFSGLDNPGYTNAVSLNSLKRNNNKDPPPVPQRTPTQLGKVNYSRENAEEEDPTYQDLDLDNGIWRGQASQQHPSIGDEVLETTQEDLYQEIDIYEQPVDSNPSTLNKQSTMNGFIPNRTAQVGNDLHNMASVKAEPIYNLYDTSEAPEVYQPLENGPTAPVRVPNTSSYEALDRGTLKRDTKPLSESVYDVPEEGDQAEEATVDPFYNELDPEESNGVLYDTVESEIYHEI